MLKLNVHSFSQPYLLDFQEAAGDSDSDSDIVEFPMPIDPDTSQPDDCRLWIGNLDPIITEFTLLKLLQKYGQLKKFDFLYHRSGPERGKARGYCFVTYSTPEEAEKARLALHGKLALSRRLVIKYAHVENRITTAPRKESPDVEPPKASFELSTETKICAIEAKLKLMEQATDEKLSNLPHPALAPRHDNSSQSTSSSTSINRYKKSKPYQRSSYAR